MKDHYQILGVDRKADTDAIKRAYRKLTMEFHPDRNPDDAKAEERFKQVTIAYDVLGDADKRTRYDFDLRRGVSQGQPIPPAWVPTAEAQRTAQAWADLGNLWKYAPEFGKGGANVSFDELLRRAEAAFSQSREQPRGPASSRYTRHAAGMTWDTVREAASKVPSEDELLANVPEEIRKEYTERIERAKREGKILLDKADKQAKRIEAKFALYAESVHFVEQKQRLIYNGEVRANAIRVEAATQVGDHMRKAKKMALTWLRLKSARHKAETLRDGIRQKREAEASWAADAAEAKRMADAMDAQAEFKRKMSKVEGQAAIKLLENSIWGFQFKWASRVLLVTLIAGPWVGLWMAVPVVTLCLWFMLPHDGRRWVKGVVRRKPKAVD